KQQGRVKIGASTIPGEYLLPRMITPLHNKFPKIEVAVAIANSSEIIAGTLAGEYELGFVGFQPDDINLEYWQFAQDQLVPVAPTNKRYQQESITLAELQKLPLIIRERGSGTFQTLLHQLEENQLQIRDFNIIAELGSSSAIKEAVMSGAGLAILSNLAIEQE